MTESVPTVRIEAHIPTGTCDNRLVLTTDLLRGETTENGLARIGLEHTGVHILTAKERLETEPTHPPTFAYLTKQTADEIGLAY